MALFQQQGELDYVAMSNAVLSTSYAVAQRVAWAGVQPLTFHAGLAMCANFRLGRMGHMRVSHALSNLRPYKGFEDILWFGFGHKSFLSLLTETEAGFNCAALCGVLAEAYHLDRASELLQALWRVRGLSTSLEPSRSQFRALVNGCSGVFLNSPFSEILTRIAGPCTDACYVDVEEVKSRPDDWARAVNAIIQIVNGDLVAIQVYGGREIAVLGALAHWLFDLSVWVDLPDGSNTFSSCRHPEQANVWLHFVDEKPSSALLQISTTTFTLRTIEDLIADDLCCPMAFRIKWDSCFVDLFDYRADEELEKAALISSLGQAIGAIARIYQGLTDCESDVGTFSRIHFTGYRPAGYGRGYIHTICNLFPEIAGISEFRFAAFENLKKSVQFCTQSIIESMKALMAGCWCSDYSRKSGCPYIDVRPCKIVLLMFMRRLANVMAHVDLKAPINPSRDGLQYLYHECARKRPLDEDRADSKLLELATDLHHAGKGNPRKAGLLDGILQDVTMVFAGYHECSTEFVREPILGGEPQCTALVKNGVCIWIDALRDLTTKAANVATVHVAPGQIIYNNRS